MPHCRPRVCELHHTAVGSAEAQMRSVSLCGTCGIRHPHRFSGHLSPRHFCVIAISWSQRRPINGEKGLDSASRSQRVITGTAATAEPRDELAPFRMIRPHVPPTSRNAFHDPLSLRGVSHLTAGRDPPV
jgi:hypothetical protein